jgi:hypothetical protein
LANKKEVNADEKKLAPFSKQMKKLDPKINGYPTPE